MGALSARLGSDPRGEELLVTVLRVLRGVLPHDTWEGMVDELPFSARSVLRSDARSGTRAPQGHDAVEAVARAMMHPVPRTRFEIAAVFASLKQALPRGMVDALANELTGELGAIWRDAR